MPCRILKQRISALFLVILITFTGIIPSAAEETDIPEINYARNAVLCNLDTGVVLLRYGDGGQIAPGPTVKIMTGLIAAERLSARLDEIVQITGEMLADSDGAKMGLAVGDKLRIGDLLYGTICGGYSDAAQALAVIISGNTDKFLALMNSKADLLYMFDTVYKNPTGIDEDGMTTTVDDLMKLAKYAAKNALYMEISSVVSYKCIIVRNSGDIEKNIFNRNSLISEYYTTGYLVKTAKGLIAGMTDEAGYCVISTATYNGARFLCIVMGGVQDIKETYSYRHAHDLFTFAAYNYEKKTAMKKGDFVCTIEVDCAFISGNEENKAEVVLADNLYVFLKSGDEEDIQYIYHLNKDIFTAPVKEGTVVGTIIAVYGDRHIGSAELVISGDVEANTFLRFMKNFKEKVFARPLLIAAISFILLTCIYFYFDKYFRIKLKRRKIKRKF